MPHTYTCPTLIELSQHINIYLCHSCSVYLIYLIIYFYVCAEWCWMVLEPVIINIMRIQFHNFICPMYLHLTIPLSIPSTNKCFLIMQLSWSSSKLMPHHRTQCNDTKQAIWISSSAPHSYVLRCCRLLGIYHGCLCYYCWCYFWFYPLALCVSPSTYQSIYLSTNIYACTTVYLFLILTDTLQSYHMYGYGYRLYCVQFVYTVVVYVCACLSSIIAYVTILNILSM